LSFFTGYLFCFFLQAAYSAFLQTAYSAYFLQTVYSAFKDSLFCFLQAAYFFYRLPILPLIS